MNRIAPDSVLKEISIRLGVWASRNKYTSRLQATWHILRGGNLMYGVRVVPGDGMINFSPENENLLVSNCIFDGEG